MQLTDFLQLLDELLDQTAGTLRADSKLEHFGWSSLAVIGFIALMDEHFEASVSPGAVAKCETTSDLAALLGDKISMLEPA